MIWFKNICWVACVSVLLICGSCQDEIGLGQLKSESRLVMYAFPTDSDTIAVSVSVTRPVKGWQAELKNVVVSGRTNGVADAIRYAGRGQHAGFPLFTFYAIGHHKEGDTITIAVKADGFPCVSGTTIIPSRAVIHAAILDTIVHKGEYYSQVRLMFGRQRHGKYYGARVLGKSVFDGDSVGYEYLEVETELEPLLNNYTNTDIEFGTWNSYYHQLYAFEDPEPSAQYRSLRLSVLQRPWWKAYQAQLFSLSEEYYLFLKSLNDSENNEIGKYGLSLMTSSYTNVKGGYGCVAGYSRAKSSWLQ